MPNYDEFLDDINLATDVVRSFPIMASWPWKKQMRFLINFCHWKRNIRQSARFHFVEIFAG